ncbi:MAG: metal-dependent transcriptional regulator [Candidatus Hodarchaeales archaeon]
MGTDKNTGYRQHFKVPREYYKKITGIYSSACLRFLFDEDIPLKTKKIAEELNLSQSTVTTIVKERLLKDGFVIYEKYGKVTLTAKGREKAKEYHRHHRLLEVFLVNELDMKPSEACKEAEMLMHAVSCKTIDLICKKYDHPKECPCQRIIYHPATCQCKDF